MNDVFAKARALGEALQASEEYRAMREAEATAMADPDAAQMLAAYLEQRAEVERLLATDAPDPAELAEHSEEMENLHAAVNARPLVVEMIRARAAFSDMMMQVNQVLRFMVIGQTNEEGCGGTCGNCCGGCTERERLQ
ncbi:MAG: YlbF family regulator [Oscillospiraceae bacterium]|jgi:cell fate (sporulation/competence/biofilm development) regulator YlbF (YheA/YmcA/DUF963 family)|nr:YlbF family regulator [Oscillospiraceae bacterium]